MKIKIIKKGTKNNEAADCSLDENVVTPPKKVETKVETNILGWVSELRERKRFEFMQAQNLFGN
jgi:hypothetical protein